MERRDNDRLISSVSSTFGVSDSDTTIDKIEGDEDFYHHGQLLQQQRQQRQPEQLEEQQLQQTITAEAGGRRGIIPEDDQEEFLDICQLQHRLLEVRLHPSSSSSSTTTTTYSSETSSSSFADPTGIFYQQQQRQQNQQQHYHQQQSNPEQTTTTFYDESSNVSTTLSSTTNVSLADADWIAKWFNHAASSVSATPIDSGIIITVVNLLIICLFNNRRYMNESQPCTQLLFRACVIKTDYKVY